MADCLLDHDKCKIFQKVCQNTDSLLPISVQPVQVADVDLVHPMPEPQPAEDPGVPDVDVHVIDDEDAHHPAEVTHGEPVGEVSKKKKSKRKAAAEECPWSRNHASKATLKKDRFGVPEAGLQVVTRRTYQDILANNKEDVEDKTNKKLLELTKDISNRLTNDFSAMKERT